MSEIESQVDRDSPLYRENYRAMRALVDKLAAERVAAQSEGTAEAIARHRARGKLTARERVHLLLDDPSSFLELMPFAGHGRSDVTVGGSIVGGIGKVSGIDCLVNASVPTIKGGALNDIGVTKSQRFDVIARENGLPTIYLTESGGADLRDQAAVFTRGGASFREIARRSQMGIPSVSVVFGNCTAGGAYIPGMSDVSIMVQGQAKVFLGGPPLVKLAIGEDVDDETLGGAEMHSAVSGVSDYLARDDREAIQIARREIAHLNARKAQTFPAGPCEAPLYDADELLGVVSPDLRVQFDPREVIARLVDASRFSEFQPDKGKTLVVGFSTIAGCPVGILANYGVLFSDSAQKGAEFIALCNHRDIPLIFLQHITGFMIGKEAEQGGIVKHGAKLVNAVSNSTVPMITIMIGASYGAGNYAMCGRAFEPRFLFSWPNAKLAVMGAAQLAGVMELVARASAKRAGAAADEATLLAQKEAAISRLEADSDAYACSGRVWDDGIIDPRETRSALVQCLSAIYSAPIRGARRFGIFRF